LTKFSISGGSSTAQGERSHKFSSSLFHKYNQLNVMKYFLKSHKKSNVGCSYSIRLDAAHLIYKQSDEQMIFTILQKQEGLLSIFYTRTWPAWYHKNTSPLNISPLDSDHKYGTVLGIRNSAESDEINWTWCAVIWSYRGGNEKKV
jgi:hypothetical protein